MQWLKTNWWFYKINSNEVGIIFITKGKNYLILGNMFMLEKKTLSCLYTLTKIKCNIYITFIYIFIYIYFFSFIEKYRNRTIAPYNDS